MPPPGDPESEHCENGGFENGDFDGWEGWTGTFTESGLGNAQLDIDIPGFDNMQIINSVQGQVDPVFGSEIPLEGIGDYFVRLGDTSTMHTAQKLRYCFTVDENNAMFSFFIRYGNA